MSQPKYTPIYSSLGKKIGRVEGGIFYKSIRGSKHILRKPPAIAVDLQALLNAEAAGASKVQITDTESGTVYTADIIRFIRRGFNINRGFGVQIALPLESFVTERPGEPVQLGLFRERAR